MSNVLNYILDLFKFAEVRAEEDKNGQERKQSGAWPRRLSFSQSCSDENEEPGPQNANQSQMEPPSPPAFCEIPEDVPPEDQCPPSFFARKMTCILHAGKVGLTEGSLTGVFFGGGWGLYKYLSFQAMLLLGQVQDASEVSKVSEEMSKSSVSGSRASRGSETGSRVSKPRSNMSGSNNSTNSASSNADSTVNENIIFVSACNSAIIVGVVCTLVSCTKAAIFC